ncbi:MAG: DUF3253 domain-containing protein [Solirubrobacterales bacterium]|nr:DUF3253 domain-containing protein [Solirubrobacterales bacterium]
MEIEAPTVRRRILELLAQRGEDKTICPSEVARALDPQNFRAHMSSVRSAAHTLVEEERIEVTQGGAVVDIRTARGPVRLGLRR